MRPRSFFIASELSFMQFGQPFVFGASAALTTGALIFLEAEKVNAEISDEDRAEFYFNRGVSKNKSGDAEIFEMKILINIKIKNKQKTFISLQNYNNNENKFELNQYEIEIEKQIINEIIDDILIYLAKF